MAIATSELQQNAAPQGTDTLLMANSAGGTTQLTLANLAKFLTEQDNAVKTALSNKAAKSAQDKVDATGVTSRTVELAAADLPAFIAGLPRLLTENLIVKVSGTLTADYLKIYNFYGTGSLTIKANADGDAVLKATAYVFSCTVMVSFQNIRFQDPTPGSTTSRSGIRTTNGCTVMAQDCSFSSTSGGNTQNNGYIALEANHGSVIITSGINASGCGCVALTQRGGVISCSAAADALHDNSEGAVVWEGGIIYVAGNSPSTLGGTSNVKYCGLIVKGGALL